MSDDYTPPFLLDRNEDMIESSLRSRSYGGPKPPDHSRDCFILLSTSISEHHTKHTNTPHNESSDAFPTPISQSEDSTAQQTSETTNQHETATFDNGFHDSCSDQTNNNHTGDEWTNTNTNLPATNNNKRHVIVHLQSLLSVVNRNLIKCNLCRTGTQCLEVVSTNSFAVSLRICCAQCDKRIKSTSESYRRLEIKQDEIP